MAVWVVVLARLERPNERGNAQTSERQGNWYEQYEYVHAARPTRTAFSITVIDDIDIAKAAANGVA